MANKGSDRKRWLRRGVPPDARDRLSAAEARIDEIRAEQERLSTELAGRHAELLEALAARAAETDTQFEAVRAQAKEDYRRQVGVLDVVRRQQKRQDETFGPRVDAVEGAVAALAVEQTTRLSQSEARTDQLEVAARVAAGRIDSFDAFRVDLGTIVERMNTTIRAIRDAVEKLSTRTDALDALSRQQLADSAALRETALAAERAVQSAIEQARAALASLGDLDQRVTAVGAAVAPLGPLPDRVRALDESVATMNDRVTAAELLVNQRDNFDLQLERAEEFERLLAEVDPATYASREELHALRDIVDGLTQN